MIPPRKVICRGMSTSLATLLGGKYSRTPRRQVQPHSWAASTAALFKKNQDSFISNLGRCAGRITKISHENKIQNLAFPARASKIAIKKLLNLASILPIPTTPVNYRRDWEKMGGTWGRTVATRGQLKISFPLHLANLF